MFGTVIALVLALSPPTFVDGALPVPEAEIIVLATAGAGDPLARQTEQLMEALEADGRLHYGRPSFDGEVFRHCLTDDPEPTQARINCVRAAFPERSGATPLVVILLGDTRERGSYQRMECVGPAGDSFLRAIYVRDFDHPRPDVSNGTRSAAFRCIRDALHSEPEGAD